MNKTIISSVLLAVALLLSTGGMAMQKVQEKYKISTFISSGDMSKLKNANRVRIKLKAFYEKDIDSAAQNIVDTANKTDAAVKWPNSKRTKKQDFEVLASSDGYEDSYKLLPRFNNVVDIYSPSTATIKKLMELDLATGIAVEISVSK